MCVCVCMYIYVCIYIYIYIYIYTHHDNSEEHTAQVHFTKTYGVRAAAPPDYYITYYDIA